MSMTVSASHRKQHFLERCEQVADVTLRNIAEIIFQYMEIHHPIVRIAMAEASCFPKHVKLVYQEPL
jgi:hypothetical protein